MTVRCRLTADVQQQASEWPLLEGCAAPSRHVSRLCTFRLRLSGQDRRNAGHLNCRERSVKQSCRYTACPSGQEPEHGGKPPTSLGRRRGQRDMSARGRRRWLAVSTSVVVTPLESKLKLDTRGATYGRIRVMSGQPRPHLEPIETERKDEWRI